MNETSTGTIKKMYSIGIAGAVLLAALGAGYALYMRTPTEESPGAAQAGDIAGDASSTAIIVNVEGSGDYTVETIPVPAGNTLAGMPQLRRPVVFSSLFPAEAQRLMTQKIDASIAALEKDPQIFNEWMQLAILRKTVDDYEGARQIWEFLAAGNPKNPLPFSNLANLYAFELKDPVRAEENFIKAMQKDPTDILFYRQAYEFYRYVRKDDGKAKEILQKGISNTKSPDLQYLLDHYSEF